MSETTRQIKKTVTLIPGDGIGPECVESARRIVAAAGVGIEWELCHAGESVFKQGVPSGVPQETIDSIRKTRCVLKGPLGTPVYKEYSGNIHDSGRHLLNLINEILDLSRIEAGRYQLTEERLRLTDVVDDCHRLLKLRAEAKGLTLTLELADDLPPVWADQRALRQICLNLMSNALKFTPKGGTITVKITNAPGGGQMLSVRDTGPGIPADEIPKVMQPFGQGSLAHQTAEGGTGLGLSIVTSLVELHDGKFELRSELRRGTEAIVILPQRRVLAAAPPLQPLGAERHRLNPELRARIQRPPAAPHAKPGASHPGNAASQPAKAALQSAHAAHPASQPSPERKPAPRRARLRDVLRA